ncbi:MAG TPA: polymer-forming cytoskeletal protein [Terriglobia bacterium]
MDLSIGRQKAPSNETNMVALVGPGTEFEGTLKAGPGQVCLNASFKGTATSDGTIIIEEQGDVAAELQARVISISGKLKGTAKASEKLEIRAHGVVLGDITSPVLVVEPGGYFDGQCHMPIPEAEKSTSPGESPRTVTI